MDVDCHNYFRCDVDVDDLTVVIGRLLDVPLIPTTTVGGTQLYRAKGIMVDPSYWDSRWFSTKSYGVGSINIELDEDHWAKEAWLSPFWSLKSRDPIKHEPAIYFSWRSTPLRIALSMRLGQFFGGTVVWADYNEQECHYVFERMCTTDEWGLISHDGESWHKYHEEMYAIEPLKPKDIERYRHYAAYSEVDL